MLFLFSEFFTLEEFIIFRSEQETPTGRLGANKNRETLNLIWEYIQVIEGEYLSSMSNEEQLMLACFILLAEGKELPV